VTQARQRAFYVAWGVPDTLQGRFEMIVLHLALVLHRLESEGVPGRRLARALTESFVVDMDDAMREMTFGDVAVPREVKRAVAALFDRYKGCLATLTASDDAARRATLDGQLAYLGHAGRLDTSSLAAYMCRMAGTLAQQSSAEILGGRVGWPDVRDGCNPKGEPKANNGG
jgi:cytochrome b pre-mRNA-processing protein 3